MQLSSFFIIALIALFGIAVTSCIVANMFLIMMIGEINRKKEEGHLISYFEFTLDKVPRVFREYRTSYPSGHLGTYALTAISVMVISGVGAAVSLLLIRPAQ